VITLLLADAIKERTLLNFALFSILMLILLFGVFGKSKWLNNTPEMKKAVVLISFFVFVIFIFLYFFSQIS